MRRPVPDLRPAVEALRLTVADTDLRRLMVAWFAAWAGRGAFQVVNLVLAYIAGGAVAVGLLGLATYLAPAVLAPLSGLPVARWRAERVLLASDVVRVLAVAAALLVVVAGAPPWALFLVVVIESGASAFTRPLHMALLPCLARTPAQLVAANVTSSAAEGIGTFLGPALGGMLLAISGPVAADLLVLAAYLLAVAAIAGVRAPDIGRGDGTLPAVLAQASVGLRAVRRIAGPRLVWIGFGLQTLVRGMLTVLIVVTAIDLLGMGDPGVGVLTAAIGLGGVIGAFAALSLTARDRLAPAFAASLAAWGAPIAVMGLLVSPAVAIVAMLAVGLSNALLDVAGFTLIQRTAPNESRVAVLGLVELVAAAGPALGSLLAPLLIEAVGIRPGLVVTGAILPLAAIALWPALRSVDESGTVPRSRVDLIRRVELFAPLSLASVEFLAGRLEPVRFAAGEVLIGEGEPGDRFIVIEHGTAEVSRAGHVVRVEGPGSGVGEIALLRDVPRTASVRALEPVDGYSLDRASFLEAVVGQAASRTAAMALVQGRLAADATA